MSIKTNPISGYDSSNTLECGVFQIFGFNVKNWCKLYKWNEISFAMKQQHLTSSRLFSQGNVT